MIRRKTSLMVCTFMATAALILLFSGCVEKEVSESGPTPAVEGFKEWEIKLTLGSLAGWWLPTWSEDGADLNVKYTRGRGTLREVIHVGKSYSPFGEQVEGMEVIYRKGEDVYGREQNMTVGTLSGWHARVKPDSVVANGTLTYPAGAKLDQSWFARSLKTTVSYEYSDSALKGGSGKGEFYGHIYGHISTSAGKITYSGSVTATFTEQDEQLVWKERIEKTNYYYDNKPYADTVTVTTPQSEYLGGKWVTVRETHKTATTYADGSKRESEIVILWQRDKTSVTTGKSGSGVFVGTEVINGKPVDYTGSITIDYSFDSRIGWYKTGYNEKISAKAGLPKHLPFEVMFIDDSYLRPVF